ncbi:unnamed protein product [Amoebophrya sp. A120]|nr:unnamed protein product [Amoebophrya sp. A120]|eukprot:GSA120T00013567001.1
MTNFLTLILSTASQIFVGYCDYYVYDTFAEDIEELYERGRFFTCLQGEEGWTIKGVMRICQEQNFCHAS